MSGHARWEGMMDAYFVGKLAAPEAATLAAHARACPACERTFQRYAIAERALEGGARPLTLAAQARVAERMFGGAAPAPERASLRWVGIGALAASAFAVALVLLVVRVEPAPSDMFHARGAPASAAGLGLRALRIRAAVGGELEVSDMASGDLRLTAHDHLRVLYTNVAGATRLTLSCTLDGRPLDVLPAEVSLTANAEDQPVGEAIEVQPGWRGTLVIRGRFSGRDPPLDRELSVGVE